MSDWKPGDVAMVECSDGQWRLALCGEAKMGIGVAPSWMFPDHSLRYVEDSNARPLVVIDPEDREAVERLWTAAANPLNIFTAALHEFANPKPPRPDEPQGLGAVVEDSEGADWHRTRDGRWIAEDGLRSRAAGWGFIDAVRVLSEGVVDQ